MAKKLKIKGKDYDVDDDGFLLRSDDRTKDWHDHAMAEEGLTEFTTDHEKVLSTICDHHCQHGALPTAAVLSRVTRMKIRYMHELFPSGPGRAACRILGLPPTDGLLDGRLPRGNTDVLKSKARKEESSSATPGLEGPGPGPVGE